MICICISSVFGVLCQICFFCAWETTWTRPNCSFHVCPDPTVYSTCLCWLRNFEVFQEFSLETSGFSWADSELNSWRSPVGWRCSDAMTLNFCTTWNISPRLRLIEERMPTLKMHANWTIPLRKVVACFKKWGHLHPSSTSSLGVLSFPKPSLSLPVLAGASSRVA